MKLVLKTTTLAVLASLSFGSFSAARAEGPLERKVAIYTSLLDCYQKLGRSKEVGNTFATLVNLKPNDAVLQYNYGYHLYTTGNVAGAIARYRKACQFDPANGDYHGNLANLLMQTKDYNGAMLEYGRAGERFRPQFDNVQKYIQQLAQQKAYQAQLATQKSKQKTAAPTKRSSDDDDE